MNPVWLDAVERERGLLSESLHEGLCQNLCGILMQIRLLERKLGGAGNNLEKEWLELQRSLSGTIEQSRALSRELKPPLGDEHALASALAEMAVSNQSKITCDWLIGEPSINLTAKQCLAFYRIVQEGLRDAVRRKAKFIMICFSTKESSAALSVADDRQLGSETDEISLLVMKSHATAIGARFRAYETKRAHIVKAILRKTLSTKALRPGANKGKAG